MTSLYFLANSLNYLVAGTGNRSEITLGYYTKYGDGGVDVLPIGGLLKSEVRALGRELGVPARVIEKPPTAGLWVGQTDEAEMGFSYDALEKYLAEGPKAVPRRRRRADRAPAEGVRSQARDAARRANRVTLHYNARRFPALWRSSCAVRSSAWFCSPRSPPACRPPSSRLRPPNPTSSSGCGRPS